MKKEWVIPDIHGCKNTLATLIEDKIKPNKNDWLYFLGDYIDRGPDSMGVVDYIMQLQEDEYNVRLLKGNHEDYLLRLFDNEVQGPRFFGIPVKNKFKKEWIKHGGRETLQSFKVQDVQQIPEKYIKWFRKLEYFMETEEAFLVHAGFNFDDNDPLTDKHSMLWIKDFKVIPEKVKHKKVIHGHVPVSLDFIDLVKSTSKFDFIDLDNGVYMDSKDGFGHLTALELNSRELLIQSNQDL